MSKNYAAVSGLLGMAVGALIASPYLTDAAECGPDQPAFTCSLNNSVAPFVGAILLGFVLGIAIGRNGQKAWQRWGPPASERATSSADGSAQEMAAAGGASAPDRFAGSAPERLAVTPQGRASAANEDEPAEEPPQRDGTLGSRGRPRPTPRTRD